MSERERERERETQRKIERKRARDVKRQCKASYLFFSTWGHSEVVRRRCVRAHQTIMWHDTSEMRGRVAMEKSEERHGLRGPK